MKVPAGFVLALLAGTAAAVVLAAPQGAEPELATFGGGGAGSFEDDPEEDVDIDAETEVTLPERRVEPIRKSGDFQTVGVCSSFAGYTCYNAVGAPMRPQALGAARDLEGIRLNLSWDPGSVGIRLALYACRGSCNAGADPFAEQTAGASPTSTLGGRLQLTVSERTLDRLEPGTSVFFAVDPDPGISDVFHVRTGASAWEMEGTFTYDSR